MARGSAPGERRGGRQAGTKNKASVARQKAIAESGLMPLDFMIQVLRDEAQTFERRQWAAKESAPYVHPKLSNTEHKITGELVAEIRWRLASA